MAELSPELDQEIQNFRNRVMTDPIGVLDPEGKHHIFNSGMHGQKLDFDKIGTKTEFYWRWISVYAQFIRATYAEEMPDALLGIANGANRLAVDIGRELRIPGLTTDKNTDCKTVRLSEEATSELTKFGRFILLVEDVGTTGGTTSSIVSEIRKVSPGSSIKATHTWIRTSHLPKLDAVQVPYTAMIHEVLPTFDPDDCPIKGFCSQGYELLGHKP